MIKTVEEEIKIECTNVQQKYNKSTPEIELEKEIELEIDIKHIVEQIINYLNLKTNKHYKTTTPKTIREIKARLNEGFNLEDFNNFVKQNSNVQIASNNNQLKSHLPHLKLKLNLGMKKKIPPITIKKENKEYKEQIENFKNKINNDINIKLEQLTKKIDNVKLSILKQKKICNFLFSLTLSSALKSLTSVFGMGTGVPSLL